MNLRPRFLVFAGVTVLAVGCIAPPRPTPKAPNIVIILADDMGYGDPSCNNPESKILTPALDRIAQEGVRFTDAHAPASWCTPTRYGLLTGRYPFRLGRFNKRCIEADRPTLATMLRGAGYTTGMVGKWHLWFDGRRDAGRDWSQPLRGGPLDCGFDSYFGIPASLDIQPYYYIRGALPVAPPTDRCETNLSKGHWTDIQGAFWRQGGVAPGFKHEQVLPDLCAEALAFLQQQADAKSGKPFFLYFALPAPHTPWLPSPKFRGKSAASMYGDFVMQVDDTVGQVLAALDRHDLSRDTLVLFTSDNGPVWYPKDVEKFGHRSVGPLRGMKSDAFEGGHRMPFFIRWPARLVAGGVSDRFLCFTDIMATLAAASGLPMPVGAGQDSVSFLPALLGKSMPSRGPTILKSNATVVRDGQWKLITQLGSGGFTKPRNVRPVPGGPRGQLYDLSVDLAETDNLWAQHPEIVARLSRALEREKAR